MSDSLSVLVLLPFTDDQKARLQNAAPGAVFHYYESLAEVPDSVLASVSAIIGFASQEALKKAVNLRWLQVPSAGVDNYVKPGMLPSGVMLTNARGAYGVAIAEFMFGLLMTLTKQMHRYRDIQHTAQWHSQIPASYLFGSTVLLAGMGNIAEEFARRLRPFGCRIIGVRQSECPKPDFVDEQYLISDLDRILPEADIVAVSLPGTENTRHMFSRKRLESMKKGSFIINVGRGSVIDSDALCDLLNGGHIAGAGLDVTDPEPLPGDHPLWKAGNALITPHVAGGMAFHETFRKIAEISTINIDRFIKGETLENLIDLSKGY